MEQYKNEILALAVNKTNQIFYNSSEAHAEIVHQAIVKTAENYICIFSGSLCTEISNNTQYCELMDQFLAGNPQRRVRIVLTDFNSYFKNRPLFDVFRKHKEQVEMRSFQGSVRRNGNPVHFAFADDRMFRLETDIEKHMAFGNFNSPEQVKSLKSVFDNVFGRSSVVDYGL